jgi:hypothetical protein
MQGSSARLLVTLTGVLLVSLIAAGAVLGALVRVPESSRTGRVNPSIGARHPVAGVSSTSTSIPAAESRVGSTAGGFMPALATPALVPSPPSPGPAPPPALQVRLTAPVAAVTIHTGTELVLDLTGTLARRWSVRSDSDPTVLLPINVSMVATTLHAVFWGVRPGTATLEIDRTRLCVWAPAPDACPVRAFSISVTVVPD